MRGEFDCNLKLSNQFLFDRGKRAIIVDEVIAAYED
jgi:hypothetical protein